MFHRGWLALAAVMVAMLMVAGCGRLKEELETAKQKVAQLTSETQNLKQKIGLLEDKAKKAQEDLQRLDEESAKLRAESKRLSAKNESLNKQTKTLQSTNEQLNRQLADLEKENRELDELRKKNKDLTETVEKLKAKSAPQETYPRAEPDSTRPTGTVGRAEKGKVPRTATPCDALIRYMRKASNVIRQLKGEERTRALQRVQAEYSDKIKGAPKGAIAAAKKWVNELNTGWDKTGSDAVFKILVHRNRVLKACGKTALEAGF